MSAEEVPIEPSFGLLMRVKGCCRVATSRDKRRRSEVRTWALTWALNGTSWSKNFVE
jgi:hypothetical protein